MGTLIKIIKNPFVQVVIAILIAWYFYSIGQKEAKPVYAVDKYQVFADIQDDVPELKLLWNDKAISNFYSGRVAIWNDGNDYIDSTRLNPLDPIRVVIPSSIKLLSFNLSALSRPDLDISATRNTFEGETTIQIRLNGQEALEPSDGFAIKIYFTTKTPEDFTVEGRVKGIPEGFTLKEWNQEFSPNNLQWIVWVLLGFALLALIDALKDSYKSIKAGKKYEIINYLPRLIFGPTASFGIIYFVIIPEYFGMVWLH